MPQILVVDDESSMRESLTLALAGYGYAIDATEDGYGALRCMTDKRYDLVLTDLMMPRMNGLELLESLRKVGSTTPVIMLTAHATVERAAEVFKAGARDLLQKPFELSHLVQSVQQALESSPDPENEQLQQVNERFRQYYLDTIQSLFAVLAGKSPALHGHCARVACYALLLAKRLDLLEAELRNLEIMALLHDIGKITVPDEILGKRPPLSAAEEKCLRAHVTAGENILKPLRFLPDADKIIRHHHEAFDGSGYPDGLAGDRIPLFSRIIAVVDGFDNRLSSRPYHLASQAAVIADLRSLSGTQFDPELTELFIEAYCQSMMLKTPPPAPA